MDKLDSIIGPNDNKIIKIFTWNIHGIGDKLETEVTDLLSAYDIILFQRHGGNSIRLTQKKSHVIKKFWRN